MIWVMVFGVPLLGLIAAAAWWALWGRRRGGVTGAVAVIACVAGCLGVLADLLVRLWSGWSLLVPFASALPVYASYRDVRFVMPLVVGIAGLILLAFPVRSRKGSGRADLTRRSPVSFARPRWFVLPAALAGLVVLLTLVAGMASTRDEVTGRYTAYVVDGGVGFVGTSIYGWFYSVPSLIALAVLGLVAVTDLVLIARPAMGDDAMRDAAVRRLRTRNVLTVTSGALLLHLAAILSDLAGVASLRAGIATSEGTALMWTPFAALHPVLTWSSQLAVMCGIAAWATVALTAIPSRRHVPVTVAAP
ncbi:hypothetical protein [Microbacterium excoecariae]|uniref:hypothetical protein n=1 Tax=Microbacterium excoecariae TaxID=2715210 RepID=UPI001F11324D|nr:hypothetical protein [Microbacterium excoecariae]